MIMRTKLLLAGLYATVFLSGACLMTVELVAGRLISRFLGSSLYTWTTVIGLVLAGLSVGNYFGGWFSDISKSNYKTLSILLFLSSISCLSVLWLNGVVGEWLWLFDRSWPVRITLHVGFVFLVPSFLIGTISPLVARCALSNAAHTGRTIGALYAWGTIGSIIGTFLTGYYLIARFGTVTIILQVSLLLAILSAIYGYRHWRGVGVNTLVLLLVMLPWLPYQAPAALAARLNLLTVPDDEDTVFFTESQYSYIGIVQNPAMPNMRSFYIDKLKHSEMDIYDPTVLIYPYLQIYEGIINRMLGLNKDPSTFLVLGGGGYTFPRFLEVTRPDSLIDVVEIDPEVTRAAVEAFGLPPDTAMKIFHMDARNFVTDWLRHEATAERYRFVLGDAVSDYSVPYQLCTVEFFQNVSDIMTEDGVLLFNFIDVLSIGRFAGSLIHTLQQVFPHVQAICGYPSMTERSTTVVICSKQPLDLAGIEAQIAETRPFRGFLLSEKQISELVTRAEYRILTDNHAPVENLLAEVVRLDKGGRLQAALARGERELTRDRLQVALAYFHQAIELHPQHVYAYYQIARIQDRLDNYSAALDAYAAVLQLDPGFVSARAHAARLLGSKSHYHAAAEQLFYVAEAFPEQAGVWADMARMTALSGNLRESVPFWQRAIELEPDNPHYLIYYSATLAELGELD
jgi:spermidine synthase